MSGSGQNEWISIQVSSRVVGYVAVLPDNDYAVVNPYEVWLTNDRGDKSGGHMCGEDLYLSDTAPSYTACHTNQVFTYVTIFVTSGSVRFKEIYVYEDPDNPSFEEDDENYVIQHPITQFPPLPTSSMIQLSPATATLSSFANNWYWFEPENCINGYVNGFGNNLDFCIAGPVAWNADESTEAWISIELEEESMVSYVSVFPGRSVGGNAYFGSVYQTPYEVWLSTNIWSSTTNTKFLCAGPINLPAYDNGYEEIVTKCKSQDAFKFVNIVKRGGYRTCLSYLRMTEVRAYFDPTQSSYSYDDPNLESGNQLSGCQFMDSSVLENIDIRYNACRDTCATNACVIGCDAYYEAYSENIDKCLPFQMYPNTSFSSGYTFDIFQNSTINKCCDYCQASTNCIGFVRLSQNICLFYSNGTAYTSSTYDTMYIKPDFVSLYEIQSTVDGLDPSLLIPLISSPPAVFMIGAIMLALFRRRNQRIDSANIENQKINEKFRIKR